MSKPPPFPAGQLHLVSRGGSRLCGSRLLLSDPNLTRQALLALPASVGWNDLKFALVVMRRHANASQISSAAAGPSRVRACGRCGFGKAGAQRYGCNSRRVRKRYPTVVTPSPLDPTPCVPDRGCAAGAVLIDPKLRGHQAVLSTLDLSYGTAKGHTAQAWVLGLRPSSPISP